jgi:hypothetical protein
VGQPVTLQIRASGKGSGVCNRARSLDGRLQRHAVPTFELTGRHPQGSRNPDTQIPGIYLPSLPVSLHSRCLGSGKDGLSKLPSREADTGEADVRWPELEATCVEKSSAELQGVIRYSS